jgi:hypothetical protein
MQMMMNMRGGAKKPTTTPSAVAVSSVLTAEVPLTAAAPDELLVAATELQEKFKAEFKAAKGPGTPEEQEVLEELAAAEMMPGQANVNEPQFLYVHKITHEEQKKALADAFAEARERAGRIAEAAGAQLGLVRDVTASIGPAKQSPEENMYAAMYANMAGQNGAAQKNESEATSPRPGPVTTRVTVSGTFELK